MARSCLLPFFGKRAIATAAETDYVGGLLNRTGFGGREGRYLCCGLEDTISSEYNVLIMERVGSPAVRFITTWEIRPSEGSRYYGKSAGWGRDRICRIHLKGRCYVGEGHPIPRLG